ncbi:hypothetical protein [uncultured Pseudokineococcus sp.]|uniref:hypothetical protein n=1 Tax=uncultured Pseudokineococcus sp. TaxID=1642928 RepID=UPI002616E7D8|nr:hypothetical protein [uncultured Pseudokineococcus sp.]
MAVSSTRWKRRTAAAAAATAVLAACTGPAEEVEAPTTTGPAPVRDGAGLAEAREDAAADDAHRSLDCRASLQRAVEEAVATEPVAVGEDAAPSPVSARTVGAFLGSVGVNTHMTYTDTPYADHDAVLEVLDATGIRHIRDGLIPGREDEQVEFLHRLEAQGGCAQLIVGGDRVELGQVDDAVGVLESVPGVVTGVEGPNELDLSDLPDWADLAVAQQTLLHDSLLADVRLRGLPLAGPSVGRPDAFSELGDLSALLDLSNLHPYPGGRAPEGAVAPHRRAGEAAAADAPVVVTETGYHDAVVDDASQPGVPEDVEAVYLPRLLLDSFARGVTRTYLYELVDEFPDDDDDQASFGLYRRDWTPKPAAGSVQRLLDLLGSRPSTETRDLAVAVRSGEADDLRTLLLNDDEGFWLALWREVPVYEERDRRRLEVEALPVEVVLQDEADLAVHQPVDGVEPVRTAVDVRALDVEVAGEPVLVRIESSAQE